MCLCACCTCCLHEEVSMPCALYTRVTWGRRDSAVLALVMAAVAAVAAVCIGVYVLVSGGGAATASGALAALSFAPVDSSNVTCARFVYYLPRGGAACVDACPAAGEGVCLAGAAGTLGEVRDVIGRDRSIAQVALARARACARPVVVILARRPCARSCWGTAALPRRTGPRRRRRARCCGARASSRRSRPWIGSGCA
jgi:hypothetical protein